MTHTVIKEGHLCDVPSAFTTVPDTIIECECGQRWLLRLVHMQNAVVEWVKIGVPPTAAPRLPVER